MNPHPKSHGVSVISKCLYIHVIPYVLNVLVLYLLNVQLVQVVPILYNKQVKVLVSQDVLWMEYMLIYKLIHVILVIHPVLIVMVLMNLIV